MTARFFFVLSTLAVLAQPAVAQPGAGGTDQPGFPGVAELLALLPGDCLREVQSDVIPCFTANPECLQSLPTAEDIGSLPNGADITACEDVSEPVCPILTRCEPCLEELGDLLACILINTEGVSKEVEDLIESCAFDCEDVDIEIDTNTTAPVASPVAPSDAPVESPTSVAETASPVAGGVDVDVPPVATPVPSTAATTMALGIVSVVAVLSTFLLV
ncbi:hypothetical protein IV203_026166 [Nitzschia inconspicua]|uniref:Uncharacterized protein n=1 Tax=Nitzschia inconspicua TaxID=303405 RepID=A0A9K3LLT6_9STRA|nr:hypothetical protein IV203_026166 [Nitzschia inconspicua]